MSALIACGCAMAAWVLGVSVGRWYEGRRTTQLRVAHTGILANTEAIAFDKGWHHALRQIRGSEAQPEHYRISAAKLGKMCAACGKLCIHCAKKGSQT